MPTYAQAADVADYIEGWVAGDPYELDRQLERAERDIDAILGPIPRSSTTGLKLDPSALQDWEAAALARAVCAQFEYRHLRGPDELVGAAGTITAEKGPDFERQYATPSRITGVLPVGLYGPKVRVELEPIAHLRRLSGTLA